MRAAAAALLLALALPAAAQDPDATAPASEGELTQHSRRMTERLKRELGNACLANARPALVLKRLHRNFPAIAFAAHEFICGNTGIRKESLSKAVFSGELFNFICFHPRYFHR